MANQLSLTIVIATYNRARSLEKCLLSLTKQTNKDFEVLVIDGGSTDGTDKVIKKFKKRLYLKVIVDKKPHLAYIRDIGWRKSKSDVVAWIDDDVVVEKQWSKYVVAQLAGSDKVGGVTGPTVIPPALLQKRDVFYFHTTNSMLGKILAQIYFSLFMQGERYRIGKIYPSGAWSPGSNFPRSKKLKRSIEVDYLEACNFAIPRKVLQEVDGFDLDYLDTSEWCEVDMAFRIRKFGYKLLFHPNTAVEHRVSSSGAYSRRIKTPVRLQNFFRFYIKTYYPKSLIGCLRFILYLVFLSTYFLWFNKWKK